LVERSIDWFRQGIRDLEAARLMVKQGFYEWACFLSQQASEKAVKAVLIRLGFEPFGHSVAGLLQEISKRFKVPNELIDRAKELDKAYIPTRYPNAHPEGAPFQLYTEVEARRLIEHAERITKYCEDILSKIQ